MMKAYAAALKGQNSDPGKLTPCQIALEALREAIKLENNRQNAVRYSLVDVESFVSGKEWTFSLTYEQTSFPGKIVPMIQPDTPVTEGKGYRRGSQIWCIRGMANTVDEEIGSKSGYIGLNNGSNIAYYRGKELYGNGPKYVLGAYRESETRHVWIAKDIYDADDVNTLNKDKHIDTGIQLPITGGYIKTLGRVKGLACPPFCTSVGGNSAIPVGDVIVLPDVSITTSNQIMLDGGDMHLGSQNGVWYSTFHVSSTAAWPTFTARPVLLPPR